MPERVTCSIHDGVADVRFNRPDKLNALDAAMFDAIDDVGDALGADRSVRAVVLSGEGRAFCAGLDVASFAAVAGVGSGSEGAGVAGALLGGRGEGRIANRVQRAAWIWQEIGVPVIAAVHGVAVGGGLQIALGADLRFVASDARLSVLEVRWGLIPDMTGTWVLPRLVGVDVAKELTWTGRMVGGPEALRLGLATRVSDEPRADALALAAELAAKSPDAIRAAKALLGASLARSAADQFVAESEMMGGLIGSPNQVEATTAWLEKRPARFAP
ncbi:MAG TPA: crotonase/enoyl-CoA hydratase family protein [Acidimicrobiales bacterium]|jgi:enoyl-CoA hydratase/carnithine racemase|nr:crotonase/enoyl-CoA hydratase family protein [Acidimicrobiales bacterium]